MPFFALHGGKLLADALHFVAPKETVRSQKAQLATRLYSVVVVGVGEGVDLGSDCILLEMTLLELQEIRFV